MNSRIVVKILMLSPLYSRLTLPERKNLVREFSQNYQLPEKNINNQANASDN